MNTLILTGGTAEQRKKAIEQTLLEWNITSFNTKEIRRDEEKQSIGVEDIRDTISHLSLLPLSKQYQCLLIPEMELLTPEAANALLKTIEEPPSRTYILIAAANADTILPTIRSRCLTRILVSAPDTLTQESNEEFLKQVHIMATGTTREKLTFLKKYLKREDALLWIDTILAFLTSHTLEAESARVQEVAQVGRKLLKARDLLQRNIQPILVMDELALP